MKSQVINMICICCGKEINRVKGSPMSSPDTAAWSYGVVHTLWAGFGSKFDTHGFIIAVCDQCIEQKMIEEIIIKVD